jgi:hypothetical protein
MRTRGREWMDFRKGMSVDPHELRQLVLMLPGRGPVVACLKNESKFFECVCSSCGSVGTHKVGQC